MRSQWLKAFYRKIIELGATAAERIDRTEREISGVTMPISMEGFEQIRHYLRKARQDIIQIATQHQADADRIYQLTWQLFPLTHTVKEEK